VERLLREKAELTESLKASAQQIYEVEQANNKMTKQLLVTVLDR
jgi:hypothetical protein